MSKPTETKAELVAMARAELKVHADCPDGIAISVLRSPSFVIASKSSLPLCDRARIREISLARTVVMAC
ncbi:hypothetical protein [Bradyrhizobium sp.]|jgi:hypothetical protein|uniref:hypothetical protein n=1 Tax=Bradyrhizobium sp. TaxID=376 RepID=UPI003C78286C